MENLIPKITSEKIKKYIDEFFLMEKGEIIKNPKKIIPFSMSSQITRRSLKHIVENRTLYDGLSFQQLITFISKAQEIIENPEVEVDNWGNKNYPQSRLLGKFNPESNKGIMIVVRSDRRGTKYVITIFRKEARNYFRLVEK